MEILLVGGKFNKDGGSSSELVSKVQSELEKIQEISNIRCINGGHEKYVNMLIELSKLYDMTIWITDNTDMCLSKISKYRKLILFVDNSNELYNTKLLRKSIQSNKLSLLVEFKRLKSGIHNFKVFGRKHNIWYDGSSVEDCITCSLDRLS